MSAAFSDQANCSECIDTEAMEPATKRARIEVKSFQEIDLASFTLKNRGKGKNGLNTFPFIASEPIRFNLTPSDGFKPLLALTSAANTRIHPSLAALHLIRKALPRV
jgi:hypothetical protein